VQEINMAAYRKRLLKAGQVLEWDGRDYGGKGSKKPPSKPAG